jgi:hypothetical protein
VSLVASGERRRRTDIFNLHDLSFPVSSLG